ncbi:MAG TPA: RNA polymerase sigma factor [Puia sp.]|jgi:RNA polymerase sigma-70 factor (ECF subfamily)|nr:RNA polymerase sigma factor [Puia sp.]
MNEKQLIEWARVNPRAFGELYDVYYPKIFGYIYRITGDHALAGDIASETFLKAWIAIGSFKWKGISISSWFFRIATNQLNQYFRRQRYTPRTMTDLGVFDMAAWDNRHAIAEDDITQKIDRFEEFEAVRRLLKRLPSDYQQVIALRYFEELSIRDIAQILKKKEGTVKSLLSRGLDKLKKMMDESATKGRP